MDIDKIRECINKHCEHCNKETCHDYAKVDSTVIEGNPDVIVKCEICDVEQYITEKDWVSNCYFIRE